MGCLFSILHKKNKAKWPTPIFSNEPKNYNTFDEQLECNTTYKKGTYYNLNETK